MNSRIKGVLKNLFNPAVSILAFVDNKSKVDKRAKIYRFAHVVQSMIGRYSYIGINSWITCVH